MFQGRVRILALIVKLFSVSHAVAAAISSSNLLGLLEAEVRKTDDTLATLNILELLFEVSGAIYTSTALLFLCVMLASVILHLHRRMHP